MSGKEDLLKQLDDLRVEKSFISRESGTVAFYQGEMFQKFLDEMKTRVGVLESKAFAEAKKTDQPALITGELMGIRSVMGLMEKLISGSEHRDKEIDIEMQEIESKLVLYDQT